MRILLLAYDFPVSQNEVLVSGEIKNPFSMALALRNKGHDVEVLTNKRLLGKYWKCSTAQHSGIKVDYWRDLPFLRGFFRYVIRSFWFYLYSRHKRYDVIYSHSAYSSLLLRKRPVLLCPHGTNVPEHKAESQKVRLTVIERLKRINSNIQGFLDTSSMSGATLIQSVSQFQQREMSEIYKVPSVKMKVVYNIPLLSHLDLTDIENSIEFDYIFVGRLAKKKGLEMLIRVAKADLSKKLLVVGGNDFFSTEDKAVIDNLERLHNVTMRMNVSEANLAVYLKKSRILLVTSYGYESLPTVILEALYLGVQVLAPAAWGNIEVLEKEQMYEEDSWDDLKCKLEHLLNTQKRISYPDFLKDSSVKLEKLLIELNRINAV